MARAKKAEGPKPGFGSAKVMGVRFKGARKLWTIPTTSRAWTSTTTTAWLSVEEEMRGAFVRIDPPSTATDDDIARVRDAATKAGAMAVKVLPRPKTAPLTRETRGPAPPRETLRQAVIAMVDGMATEDRPALADLVEKVAAKAGL